MVKNDQNGKSGLKWSKSTYRPERPKGGKDEVKRPEGPPARSRAPDLNYVKSLPIPQNVKNTLYISFKINLDSQDRLRR